MKNETEATNLLGLSFSVEDEQTRRRRKRNVFFDENKEVGHEFTIREDFKVNSFYVISDNTKAQLSQRAQKYEVVLEPFCIFFD